MATLNTSLEGPAITKAYESIVEAPAPSGSTASSPTYGQWAVYSVQAPLANAFQQDSSKESVLKVFRTGEGELVDLVDEFSDGKIQFAFVKVKDPNTTLRKSVLIAWCGEGVPERTKGYFTSHLAAVSKILHGYHVQVTARSDNDLTPDGIIQKVGDASGSKYSGDNTPRSTGGGGGPPPPVASKPVFTPSRVGGGGGGGGFNPLGSRSRQAAPSGNIDSDGWGDDAPQVTRSQLEKVGSAYKPTKVNMNDLTSQKQEPSRFNGASSGPSDDRSDLVKGGYQPIGKVDIAAIRRQAKESGQVKDDRPTAVKGSYEPVGKVDIAAIRARSQAGPNAMSEPTISPAQTGGSARSNDPDASEPKSLADRSAAFTNTGRISSMPKPKVANKFGGASNFTGTKAPAPGGFEGSPTASSAAPIGTASRTFADKGGKTPAQVWAEKKAREGRASGTAIASRPVVQSSASGQWESGYTGKKWSGVETTRTGTSAVSADKMDDEPQDEEEAAPSGGVSSIRDRFKNAAPMGGAVESAEDDSRPPPMDLSSKPSSGPRGVAMPGLPSRNEPADYEQRMPTPPAQPPRSPEPEMEESDLRPSSPIRIAQPVARTEAKEMEAPEERFSPPPMPVRSLAEVAPEEHEMEPESLVGHHDAARAAGAAAATTTFGAAGAEAAAEGKSGGKRALVQFDYEKAEENELELKEGDYVTNIDMVDEDWWMGENSHGESGLFPSNYVELIDDDNDTGAQQHEEPTAAAPAAATAPGGGKTATAQFDYEAAEENELTFPENAKITNVEFPDDDWWLGEYNGKQGLFPANYVELD